MMDSNFPISDTVGAWVPHGRFTVPARAEGPLSGLHFAVKDVFDVAGHPTGAGNPVWLDSHPVPPPATRWSTACSMPAPRSWAKC